MTTQTAERSAVTPAEQGLVLLVTVQTPVPRAGSEGTSAPEWGLALHRRKPRAEAGREPVTVPSKAAQQPAFHSPLGPFPPRLPRATQCRGFPEEGPSSPTPVTMEQDCRGF